MDMSTYAILLAALNVFQTVALAYITARWHSAASALSDAVNSSK